MTNRSTLDAVHETATGLHKASAMDAATVGESDALCLPPVDLYRARQIKMLRPRHHARRAVFAANLYNSLPTVWLARARQATIHSHRP